MNHKQPDPDAGPIERGHVCKHGIRWPHECRECFDALPQTTTKPTEGWTWLIGSPRWHYMRENRSLCGKWACFGKPTLEQGNDASPDNCAACRKKLAKEKGLPVQKPSRKEWLA
jgi:hypothetical protein